MIIDSSYVNMTSDRTFKSYVEKESITVEERAGSEIKLDISKEGQTLMEQMKTHQEEKKQKNNSQLFQLVDLTDEDKKVREEAALEVKDRYDMKLEMLKKLLEALRRSLKEGKKLEPIDVKGIELKAQESTSFKLNSSYAVKAGANVSTTVISAGSATMALPTNKMVRTTVTSAFETELEHTAFCSKGNVKTADGREIDFDVTLELSRAFCQKYETFSQEEYIKVDPLVINIGNESAKLTDMKFMFDLDADGRTEGISFTDKGSGFLAYDKNDDGVINDGSELFGTKSGDGFKELEIYDKDQNGWIDEADDIFKHLKVWTLDDNGEKQLIDLKEAGIGAIYLGNAQTQFTLDNHDANGKNGFIQKTGVFLKENGVAGTIQHVDLTL